MALTQTRTFRCCDERDCSAARRENGGARRKSRRTTAIRSTVQFQPGVSAIGASDSCSGLPPQVRGCFNKHLPFPAFSQFQVSKRNVQCRPSSHAQGAFSSLASRTCSGLPVEPCLLVLVPPTLAVSSSARRLYPVGVRGFSSAPPPRRTSSPHQYLVHLPFTPAP